MPDDCSTSRSSMSRTIRSPAFASSVSGADEVPLVNVPLVTFSNSTFLTGSSCGVPGAMRTLPLSSRTVKLRIDLMSTCSTSRSSISTRNGLPKTGYGPPSFCCADAIGVTVPGGPNGIGSYVRENACSPVPGSVPTTVNRRPVMIGRRAPPRSTTAAKGMK